MKELKKIGATPASVVVAPAHIGGPAASEGGPAGAQAIAALFGVKRRTVIKWRKEGAPIICAGNRLQAEYNALMKWLIERDKLKKELF